MKKFIVFALACFSFIACEKKEDTATPEIKLQTTDITYAKESSVRASGQDLKVELLSVEDSRCPINAECIQAGSAFVKFSVSDGSNETDVAITFKGDDKGASQSFRLGSDTYELTVSQVLPFPVTSKTPELGEYKISVSIAKK
ncbi:hypothetical protein [Dyadobacter helix]|nr:hypothetical protein [Dyadobacter sp. CECT 9275]